MEAISDLANLCQNFVLGEEGTIPKKLAEAISCQQISLLSLVESLGIFLTSAVDENRVRGTRLLSAVLHRLKDAQFQLSRKEVDHFASFYCDRLKDKVLVLPQVLFGLQALVTFQGFSDENVLQVIQSLNKELYVQAHPQAERRIIYTILAYFLSNHLNALRSLNNDFVFGYIKAMEGEKDPRNLIIVFQSILVIIQQLPFDLFVEELFEVTACYFPIDFTPPPNDPFGISREELVLALRKVLSGTSKFSEFCLPLLLDKLSSDLTSAKLDSLRTLTACCPVYGAANLKVYLEPLWYGIRREVYQSGEDEVEEAACESLTCLARTLSRSTTQSGEDSLLEVLFDLIMKDCLRYIKEPEHRLMAQTSKVLLAVARSSVPALYLVLGRLLPLLTTQFNSILTPSQQCGVVQVLTDFLSLLHSMRQSTETPADELYEPLKEHKESILFIIISCTNTESYLLQRHGLCCMTASLLNEGLLDIQEVTHCGQILVSLALDSPSEDIRRESSCGLVTLSSVHPEVCVAAVLPMVMKRVGTSGVQADDGALHTPQLTPSDLPAILLLLNVSVNSLVCQVTLPLCVQYLQHLSEIRTPGEDVIEMTQEIAKQLAAVVQGNVGNKDVLKLFALQFQHLLKICVVGSWADNSCIVADAVLAHLGTALRTYIQNVHNSQKLCNVIVQLFLEGDLTVIECEQPLSSSQHFNPFSSSSGNEQKLIVLLKDCICSQQPEVLADHCPVLLRSSITLALTSEFPTVVESVGKMYAAVINKMVEEREMNSELLDDLQVIWSILSKEEKSVKKERAITALLWLCKGLLMRSHPLGIQNVVKLLELFEDPSVGRLAGERFYLLLKDFPDVLNDACHAVTKLMYKQQFFHQVLPNIMSLFDKAKEGNKSFYLQSVSHICTNVSEQVLLSELPKVLPLLIESLQCSSNEDLIAATLEGVCALVMDTPTSICSYVPSLIPKLLQLAKMGKIMKIRINSLKCIGLLVHLPHHIVYPYQGIVIKGLAECLDDKKRLVRKVAAESRSQWFLLGQSALL